MKITIEKWETPTGRIKECLPNSGLSAGYKNSGLKLLGTVEIEITPPKKKKTVYRWAYTRNGVLQDCLTDGKYENKEDYDRRYPESIGIFELVQRIDSTAEEVEE
jgi:hypothetical protein